jgi:hypothetical protein
VRLDAVNLNQAEITINYRLCSFQLNYFFYFLVRTTTNLSGANNNEPLDVLCCSGGSSMQTSRHVTLNNRAEELRRHNPLFDEFFCEVAHGLALIAKLSRGETIESRVCARLWLILPGGPALGLNPILPPVARQS